MHDDAERQGLLTFVIVGGGTTASKWPAPSLRWRDALRHDFRRIDPRSSRIILIEAGRGAVRVSESLSATPRARSQSMGVEVELGRMVTSYNRQGMTLKNGRRINAATVIWAARRGRVASSRLDWR